MYADVDDRFVDVDFRLDPNYTFGAMVEEPYSVFASYKAAMPTYPRSEWQQRIEELDAAGGGLERLVTRIYNQKSEGSCVANACSQAHEIVQAVQFGKDKVTHLSAISLYKRIGRSPGSGAMVSDGLKRMCKEGVLPLDDAANRAKYGDKVMPNTGFYTKYPEGWESTAASFKGLEWFVIDDMESLVSALLNQHPVVVGREGHSIVYVRPTWANGKVSVIYPNSWGDWGFGAGDHESGFGKDSENQVRKSSGWAFALTSVTDHVAV